MARRIGDDAVRKATGKPWREWFGILDRKSAGKSHREIATMLAGTYGLPLWWSQMVTVTWEQERGIREVHQQAGGFTANVSRTFSVPVGDLFAAWSEARRRTKWLGEKVTIRKATAPKSIRITWGDGTNVEAIFAAKGERKATVAVSHTKLASGADVAERKRYWAAALGRLLQVVEER